MTVGLRPNRSVARSNRWLSMASRWAMSASDARYSCIAPMVSKSAPRSSPRALRSCSQRRVARSEPGAAMRATIEPMAAARSGAPTPSVIGSAGRPSRSSAHRPACSTPTERGRAMCSVSMSTARTSPGAGSAPVALPPRATRRAAMRRASASTSGGQSGASVVCPLSASSMRWHSSDRTPRGNAKWRPRLSIVRWRTLAPTRSERTRRWV